MVEAMQKKTCLLAILSLIFGCLLLIPFIGMLFSMAALVLGIIALVTISKEENNLKGMGLAISGIVLGAVGMIIPVLALLAAIAIPNLLRARISANDSAAKAAVMTISTASEAYAAANGGKYPMSESALASANPPYLSQAYNNQVIYGYQFSLDLNSDSYKVVAKPENCGTTGTKVIVVTTGGVIQEDECK